jgi:hypothetical protein
MHDSNIQDFAVKYGKRPKVRTPVAAAYLGLAAITLETDRYSQKSDKLDVPFHRLGRAVVYDLDELDSWLASRRDATKAVA